MRIMEDLIGKEVLDSSAVIIGRVKDVEVDIESNGITALIIGKGGISESLGFSNGEMVISYDAIKQIGDKILIENK